MCENELIAYIKGPIFKLVKTGSVTTRLKSAKIKTFLYLLDLTIFYNVSDDTVALIFLLISNSLRYPRD